MAKTRVLFLCTGNSARSQMAEAFLAAYGGGAFEAYSAGIEPKGINPYTVRVMREVGIDLAGQRSKHLNEYLGKTTMDYVITVCANAEERCPVFPGRATRLHWPFDDPAACQGGEDACLAQFRQVRDRIAAAIRAWIREVEPGRPATAAPGIPSPPEEP